MGFLMGAYGKLMTGKLVRDIQFQMLGIQSRLRRVTREIGEKEKMYAAQERNMSTMMQGQMQATQMGWLQARAASGDKMAMLYASGMFNGGYVDPSAFGQVDYNSQYAFTTMYSMFQQKMQMQFAQAQNLWKDTFEMQKNADLQALKDLEDELQIENDNLKSRLELAKQEYEAFKQEEKADAKGIVPEYTPSQG